MSTLSGNTIASSYPSLLRIDNFTGSSPSNLEQVVDGLGNRIPMYLSGTKIRFRDIIELETGTDLILSGTSIDTNGATMDFTTTNTTGIVKNVAVKDSGGRQTGIDGLLNYSGGTGISISEDVGTNTFTFTNTASNNHILYIGTGITTTAGKAVYWNGTEWVQSPTSSNAYDKLIGIAVGTDTLTDGVYISGLITLAAQTGYNAGALYLPASVGAFSEIPDYTAGNAQRGIGHSLGSLGIILNPDIYYIINNGNTSFITTNDDEVLITNDGFALSYE